MKPSKPLVSVIIPTYSRPDNLLRAIESVLNQNYSPIEIIVVDDNGKGSFYQKETEKILRKYLGLNNFKYVVHDINRNGSAARNTGLKISQGEYINFLDDDDEFQSSKISAQVELLIKNPEYEASYTDTEIVKKNNKKKIITPIEVNDVSLILSGEIFFNTSTVLFRRKILNILNGFDESFKRHQDYELYVRFFRKFKMIKCNCPPLLKYDTVNIVTQNPEKALTYLEYFFNSFRKDILSSKKSKKIYTFQYNSLLILALKNKNFAIAKYCYRKIIENKQLDVKTILKDTFYLVKSVMPNRVSDN